MVRVAHGRLSKQIAGDFIKSRTRNYSLRSLSGGRVIMSFHPLDPSSVLKVDQNANGVFAAVFEPTSGPAEL
jgi:hypothetical protein